MTFPTTVETVIAVPTGLGAGRGCNSPPIGMTKLSNTGTPFSAHFPSWNALPNAEIGAELCHTSNISAPSPPARFNPCLKSPIATPRIVKSGARRSFT